MLRNLKNSVKRALKTAHRSLICPRIVGKDIQEHIRRLEVRSGVPLMVHSSLSALGNVAGGADTVVQAILDVMGNSGTAVFPAHTWPSVNRGKRTFDVRNDPSEVGSISERARTWPGARRSLHPTHSVCAIGNDAETMTRDHLHASSPCGDGTPYSRIMDMGGQILLLGVGLQRNTCFHAVEAMAGVPYLLKPSRDAFAITDHAGNEHHAHVQCHAKAVPSRFADMETPLREAGCLRDARLGTGRSILIEASAMRDAMLPILQQEPEFFLERCSTPVGNRMIGGPVRIA